MKVNAVLIAALLSVFPLAAAAQDAQREPDRAKLQEKPSRTALIQKAGQAYMSAESLETALNEKPEAERTRAEYLKVINAYQRVYLITPHTGWADNALMAIARLYEEIHDNANAVKSLTFLIREYPGTPFKDTAEKDIVRLQGGTVQKTIAVDNIRYWEAQNSVRVVVDITGDVTFSQGDAKGPDRVFIDLSPARLNSALMGKQWPVKSGLLQQIRVGQYDASTVRVVLDVGTIGRVTSFTLRDPDRLIIDVLGREVADASAASDALPAPAAVTAGKGDKPSLPLAKAESHEATGDHSGETAAAAAKPAPAKVSAAASAKPAASAEPAAKPAPPVDKVITPAKAPNAGTRSLVRSLGLKLTRVVIDAGHGGHDTGSIGPGGYTEKELVLDVAQRLKELVEMELGAEVVMTRSDDTFVPLESRTAIANQQEADLLISIHANSSRIRAARGVETYFLNFTSSREALETASRENAASERSIHELQDLVKKIMLRDKVDESRELAQHIQRSMMTRKNPGTDRGVKQAPFVVLIGANMPSILAEVCFISNPQEEKLIKIPENRQAIAQSLFEGVRSYAESLSGTKTVAAKTPKSQE
jgi:N-acetylmuramoyl-L-alanine amidase